MYSQECDYSFLIKAGRASDNDSWGNFGGGGGGEWWWDSGPQITVGLEKTLNTKFSALLIISYSWFKYNDHLFPYDNTNSGYKRYFDVMSNIKYNIWVFYLNLGTGFSHQSSDEIRFLDSTQYHYTNAAKYPSKNKFVFSGMFSLGLDINIYDRFSIIAEGNLFFREYLSSSWQIGIKYSVPEL